MYVCTYVHLLPLGGLTHAGAPGDCHHEVVQQRLLRHGCLRPDGLSGERLGLRHFTRVHMGKKGVQ